MNNNTNSINANETQRLIELKERTQPSLQIEQDEQTGTARGSSGKQILLSKQHVPDLSPQNEKISKKKVMPIPKKGKNQEKIGKKRMLKKTTSMMCDMLDNNQGESDNDSDKEIVDSAIFRQMENKLKEDLRHEIPIVREKYVDVVTILNPDQTKQGEQAKIVFLVNEFNSIRAGLKQGKSHRFECISEGDECCKTGFQLEHVDHHETENEMSFSKLSICNDHFDSLKTPDDTDMNDFKTQQDIFFDAEILERKPWLEPILNVSHDSKYVFILDTKNHQFIQFDVFSQDKYNKVQTMNFSEDFLEELADDLITNQKRKLKNNQPHENDGVRDKMDILLEEITYLKLINNCQHLYFELHGPQDISKNNNYKLTIESCQIYEIGQGEPQDLKRLQIGHSMKVDGEPILFHGIKFQSESINKGCIGLLLFEHVGYDKTTNFGSFSRIGVFKLHFCLLNNYEAHVRKWILNEQDEALVFDLNTKDIEISTLWIREWSTNQNLSDLAIYSGCNHDMLYWPQLGHNLLPNIAPQGTQKSRTNHRCYFQMNQAYFICRENIEFINNQYHLDNMVQFQRIRKGKMNHQCYGDEEFRSTQLNCKYIDFISKKGEDKLNNEYLIYEIDPSCSTFRRSLFKNGRKLKGEFGAPIQQLQISFPAIAYNVGGDKVHFQACLSELDPEIVTRSMHLKECETFVGFTDNTSYQLMVQRTNGEYRINDEVYNRNCKTFTQCLASFFCFITRSEGCKGSNCQYYWKVVRYDTYSYPEVIQIASYQFSNHFQYSSELIQRHNLNKDTVQIDGTGWEFKADQEVEKYYIQQQRDSSLISMIKYQASTPLASFLAESGDIIISRPYHSRIMIFNRRGCLTKILTNPVSHQVLAASPNQKYYFVETNNVVNLQKIERNARQSATSGIYKVNKNSEWVHLLKIPNEYFDRDGNYKYTFKHITNEGLLTLAVANFNSKSFSNKNSDMQDYDIEVEVRQFNVNNKRNKGVEGKEIFKLTRKVSRPEGYSKKKFIDSLPHRRYHKQEGKFYNIIFVYNDYIFVTMKNSVFWIRISEFRSISRTVEFKVINFFTDFEVIDKIAETDDPHIYEFVTTDTNQVKLSYFKYNMETLQVVETTLMQYPVKQLEAPGAADNTLSADLHRQGYFRQCECTDHIDDENSKEKTFLSKCFNLFGGETSNDNKELSFSQRTQLGRRLSQQQSMNRNEINSVLFSQNYIFDPKNSVPLAYNDNELFDKRQMKIQHRELDEGNDNINQIHFYYKQSPDLNEFQMQSILLGNRHCINNHITLKQLQYFNQFINSQGKIDEKKMVDDFQIENFKININGSSLFHIFAKSTNVIQKIFSEYQKAKSNKFKDQYWLMTFPLMMLNTDFRGKTALSLALSGDNKNFFNFQAMIFMLKDLHHYNFCKQMYTHIPNILMLDSIAGSQFLSNIFWRPYQIEDCMFVYLDATRSDDDQNYFISVDSPFITEEMVKKGLIQNYGIVQKESEFSNKSQIIVDYCSFDWLFENEQLLREFFTCMSNAAHPSLYEVKGASHIVQACWELSKNIIIVRALIPFVLLMLGLIVQNWFIAQNFESWFEDEKQDQVTTIIVLLVYIFPLWAYYLSQEILSQFKSQAGFLNYFQNMWNYLDMIVLIDTLFIQAYTFHYFITKGGHQNVTADQVKEANTVLANACALLGWALFIKLFYWLRIFDAYFKQIKLIVTTITDLKEFIMLQILIWLAFAYFFYVLQTFKKKGSILGSDEEEHYVVQTYVHDDGSKSTVADIANSLYMIYLIMLGEFSNNEGNYAKGDAKYLALIMFVLASFLLCVIFMNMLIAFMSATFTKVMELNSKSVKCKENLDFIQDFDAPLALFNKLAKKHYKYVARVSKVEMDQDLGEVQDEGQKNKQQQEKINQIHELMEQQDQDSKLILQLLGHKTVQSKTIEDDGA